MKGRGRVGTPKYRKKRTHPHPPTTPHRVGKDRKKATSSFAFDQNRSSKAQNHAYSSASLLTTATTMTTMAMMMSLIKLLMIWVAITSE